MEISAVGLGGMAMTAIYGETDEREAIATVHAALDDGQNLIDTSDAYGGGKNEVMFGLRSSAGAMTRYWRLSSIISAHRSTAGPNM